MGEEKKISFVAKATMGAKKAAVTTWTYTKKGATAVTKATKKGVEKVTTAVKKATK